MNLIKKSVSSVLIISAVFTGCLSNSSFAQGQEEAIIAPWYASFSIGRMQYEGDEELKSGFMIAPRIGYDFNDRWTFEGGLLIAPGLEANTDDFPTQDDATMIGVTADGLFHFTRWKRVDPYLSAGLGVLTYSEDMADSDKSSFVLRGGAGLMYHINDEWAIRGDFRGMLSDFGGSANANSTIDAGVIWTWGAGVEEDWGATDEPKDSDGDRLSDLREKDIGTDPYDPDSDDDRLSDGDEVLDYHTDPLNADSDWDMLSDGDEVLTYKTKPLLSDTDNGGVKDGHEVLEDQTDPNVGADDLVLYTLNIEFDTNKSVVKGRYLDQISVIAKVLNRNPGSKASIEGHADQRKKSVKAYNEKLSKRRAAAVLDSLVRKNGIARNRLKSVGYGFSRPKAPNDPVTGSRENRRVEVYISGVADKSNLPVLPPVSDMDPADK